MFLLNSGMVQTHGSFITVFSFFFCILKKHIIILDSTPTTRYVYSEDKLFLCFPLILLTVSIGLFAFPILIFTLNNFFKSLTPLSISILLVTFSSFGTANECNNYSHLIFLYMKMDCPRNDVTFLLQDIWKTRCLEKLIENSKIRKNTVINKEIFKINDYRTKEMKRNQ